MKNVRTINFVELSIIQNLNLFILFSYKKLDIQTELYSEKNIFSKLSKDIL